MVSRAGAVPTSVTSVPKRGGGSGVVGLAWVASVPKHVGVPDEVVFAVHRTSWPKPGRTLGGKGDRSVSDFVGAWRARGRPKPARRVPLAGDPSGDTPTSAASPPRRNVPVPRSLVDLPAA
jgi:hypothetical protein